jgi:hypothetical protein
MGGPLSPLIGIHEFTGCSYSSPLVLPFARVRLFFFIPPCRLLCEDEPPTDRQLAVAENLRLNAVLTARSAARRSTSWRADRSSRQLASVLSV